MTNPITREFMDRVRELPDSFWHLEFTDSNKASVAETALRFSNIGYELRPHIKNNLLVMRKFSSMGYDSNQVVILCREYFRKMENNLTKATIKI